MRTRNWKLTVAGALAFALGFATAVRSAPPDERFDHKVRNDFFAGFTGDQEALDRGMKTCESILASNPKHAEALVWHGGGLYFRGSQAFIAGDNQKGMELVTRGLKEMDDAVALAPDSIGVRIPRGAILLNSSRFVPNPEMSRSLLQKGLSDYHRAFDLQKSTLLEMGTHPRGELLFGLAEGYSRSGDEAKARSYFEMILESLKGTGYAKRAELWMATKSIPPEQTGCIGCHVAK